MKTFFLVLCLIITSRLANATTQTKFNPDKPPRLYVKEYTVTDETTQIPFEPEYWSDTPIYSRDFSTWQDELDSHADTEMDWEDGGIDFINCYWPAATWPDLQGGTKVFVMPNRPNWTNSTTTPAITWEHCILKESGTLFDSTLLRERTAQTKILMETGGKTGVSRQNLFNISGEAIKIPAKAWVFSPYGIVSSDSPTAIPPEQVSISDFGNLGSDRSLWHVLPDNSPPIVITPYVKGNDFYTFNLGAQKYKLHIVANDYPLAEDRVRPQAYYCVGQKLNFEGMFSPSPSGLNYTSPIWNYTAEYINNHWTDANGCEEYNIAPIPAMSNPTKAWFYNKQTQDVTANLGLYCKFDNGQSVYLLRKGMFNVYRPATVFYPPNAGNPQMILTNGLITLGFHRINDMNFKHSVEARFSGLAGYTQLCDGFDLTGG